MTRSDCNSEQVTETVCKEKLGVWDPLYAGVDDNL